MAIGIYKAWKRKAEITSTEPMVFTNNIQVLLSVFAFSTFIISTSAMFIVWLYAQMGAFLMLAYQMFVGGMIAVVAVMGISLLVATIYIAKQLISLFWCSRKGIRYEYDPKKTPDNILMAIEPIDEENNLKDYKYILDRLIKTKSKLNKEITELIGTYTRIIREMEKKDGKAKSGSVSL